ncbi:MAG: hypothetical protein ACR5LD_08150 [Symbiopectobacterium sp.]
MCDLTDGLYGSGQLAAVVSLVSRIRAGHSLMLVDGGARLVMRSAQPLEHAF